MARIEASLQLAARKFAKATRQVSLARLPDELRVQLRIHEGRAVLVLPLSARDTARAISTCSPVDIPRELVDSLESLASQVSLAVEGALLAEDLHRRQSEARFRSLVAHSSDLMLLDAHGTVTYQSPSVERVLDYRPGELEGTDFARLLRKADRPRSSSTTLIWQADLSPRERRKSACLAENELGSTDAEELLRNADVAMYMAKRDSKGSYRVFEPEMHERVVERLELQAELQRALELNQLKIDYQPVVRLDQRADYGVEALLRWMHPTRGTMPPLNFIPLAQKGTC